MVMLAALALLSTQSASPTAEVPVAILPQNSRVLFQGDSITDMNRGRTDDPNHILGHSYAFLVAARAASLHPERNVTFINRGVSGNKVTDLQARWKTDTLDLKPDVLSILVGINDLNQGVTPADFEANYDKLLTETRAALPNAKLVLCEPFGLPTGKRKDIWPDYSAKLAEFQKKVAQLAFKHRATLVYLQHEFDQACDRAPADHWIWDGVHPTYAGQQLLADAWTRTVNKALVDPLYDPARNSAIDPQVNFERDSYDWLHRHADELDAQAKMIKDHDGKLDVVMIGDSITHFWGGEPKANQSNGPDAWADTFKGLRVLNLGFGWDRTQNVLWRLNHGEFQGLTPKSIVLNIGTNNLVGDPTARENTPAEVAVGIQAVIEALHRRSPSSKIFVMAVFPRGFEKGNDLDRRITQLNQILKTAIAGQPQVTLLDIGNKLRQLDGSISNKILFDGTHPTNAGYQIWGNSLRDAGALGSSN